jgi:hypothetical protein
VVDGATVRDVDLALERGVLRRILQALRFGRRFVDVELDERADRARLEPREQVLAVGLILLLVDPLAGVAHLRGLLRAFDVVDDPLSRLRSAAAVREVEIDDDLEALGMDVLDRSW